MGTHFRNYSFPDDKTSFHYINPGHEGTFRIPGETEIGNEFFFEGTLENHAKGFLVKFQEKEKAETDPCFSYDFQIGSGSAVMSSTHGDTVVEEGMNCFYRAGSSFFMHIKTGSDFYKVSIDGEEATVYKVRDGSAITKPHYISISGDVQIRTFHILKNEIMNTGHYAYVKGGDRPYMTIPGNVKIGDIFTFYGRTPGERLDPNNGHRMIIEFMDTPGDYEDVWFHFNPRFDWNGYNCIVRNSYKASKEEWGEQEGVNEKNPLALDSLYTCDIVVEKEQFRCWLNGTEFCTYKHRMPFEKITKTRMWVTDAKSIKCHIISVVMTRASCRTPKSLGYRCGMKIEKAEKDCINFFPNLPMDWKLPNQLNVGNCISILGRFQDAQRFSCVLKSQNSDKCLEMIADFDKQEIFLGDEAKLIDTKFPFYKQGYFNIQIFCTNENELVVTVDEVQLHQFQPCSDYKDASYLHISGDARVSLVALLRA